MREPGASWYPTRNQLCSTKWHGTSTRAHFVEFKHFIAMLLYVTKWHGTGTGAHFVKSNFKSVFHEVARDLHARARFVSFKKIDRKDTKKLLITMRNGQQQQKTGIGTSCPLLGKNAIHGNAMNPLQG